MLPVSDFAPERAIELLAEALPQGLSDALRLANRLSLYEEEGRPLRLLFALTRTAQQRLPRERRLASPVTPFDEVRRLCFATDPERACLRLERTDGSSEFRIVAIAGRPDLSPFTGSRRGDIVLIEVTAPGRLTVSAGDDLIVRCDRGEYYQVDALPIIRGLLPAAIPAAIVAYANRLTELNSAVPLGDSVLRVEPAAFEQYRKRFEQTLETIAPDLATDGIYLIAEYANRRRHGGILLFLDQAEPRAGVLQPRFDFEPPLRSSFTQEGRWNTGMLDYLGWLVHRRLALDGLSMLQGLEAQFQGAEGLKKWVSQVCDGRLARALDVWRFDARMSAQLTQVDGAVVFDSLLSPSAFGVTILGVTESAIESLPPLFRDIAGARGMRHKSAACAVSQIPGSLGIVISQDGAVTAFRHDADGTKSSRELRI